MESISLSHRWSEFYSGKGEEVELFVMDRIFIKAGMYVMIDVEGLGGEEGFECYNERKGELSIGEGGG